MYLPGVSHGQTDRQRHTLNVSHQRPTVTDPYHPRHAHAWVQEAMNSDEQSHMLIIAVKSIGWFPAPSVSHVVLSITL